MLLRRLFSRSGALPIARRTKMLTLPPVSAAAAFRSPSVRTLSLDSHRHLNEDNMIHHHIDHGLGRQEWSTFQGKISILQDKSHPKDGHGQQLAPEQRSTVRGAPVTEENVHAEAPRVSVLMELTDSLGILHDVLRYFWKHDVNICRIESRPAYIGPNGQKKFDFYIDFHGSLEQESVQKLMNDLYPISDRLLLLDEKDVQWFPRHISELDSIVHRTQNAGVELESDHPGFTDREYRNRRNQLARAAEIHRWDQPIARIEYTQDETNTWTTVWDKMEPLLDKYACREYKHALKLMKENCGYSRDAIPQQQDISSFLYRHTGFRMRPVAGLLSSRDFLNGLAFRVFFSTQYIRHHSQPLYTPEPDICHELLGHAPMFADRDFADFSQEIGLASLGASDEDIDKLAHCYWHSVEFGLCQEQDGRKAYGAGLLSSYGELEYACSDRPVEGYTKPEIREWDPNAAASQPFPVTSYQPVYFLARSLADAKQQMRRYCEDLPRPFYALHNAQTDSIHIDRPIRRRTLSDK